MKDKYTEAVVQAVRECNIKNNIVTKYGVVKISTIYALYDGMRSINIDNMPLDVKASIYAPFSLKLSGGGLIIWSYFPDRWTEHYTDRVGGQVEIRDIEELEI